jgi:predicted NodU family carbamoyl transferase
VPRSRIFPWSAIDAVLRHAGLRERDVDVVAVAGRFTPPLIVRRMPSLAGMAGQNPFSSAADLAVYFQAAMRGTGMGAMEAERAAEWLERRFRERGFLPQRVVLVDLHKALAEAVYRCQPDDDVAVITLHPLGDGAVCAVHHGRDGQLDRVWEQRGFNGLHLHLARCSRILGFEPLVDDERMFGLGARGRPREHLLSLLRRQLRSDGPRLECAHPVQLGRQAEAVYRALAEAPKEDAAASILANLVEAISALVAHHAAALGTRVIGVGGALFENPRLIAALAELDGVDRVWCHPTAGFASLPTGAAVTLGGVVPRELAPPGLGAGVDPGSCARALDAAGITGLRAEDPASVLAEALAGGPVARFDGRAGFGRHGLGTRTLLVRADRPDQVEASRQALGRPVEEEPLALALAESGLPGVAEQLAGPLSNGAAAPKMTSSFAERYGSVVAPDGRTALAIVTRASDPVLHASLEGLRDRTGCSVLAGWPLGLGREPVVSRAGDAVRAWRVAGIGALALGPFLARRAGA